MPAEHISSNDQQGQRGSQGCLLDRDKAQKMAQTAWLPMGNYSQIQARMQEKEGSCPTKKPQSLAQFLVLSQLRDWPHWRGGWVLRRKDPETRQWVTSFPKENDCHFSGDSTLRLEKYPNISTTTEHRIWADIDPRGPKCHDGTPLECGLWGSGIKRNWEIETRSQWADWVPDTVVISPVPKAIILSDILGSWTNEPHIGSLVCGVRAISLWRPRGTSDTGSHPRTREQVKTSIGSWWG